MQITLSVEYLRDSIVQSEMFGTNFLTYFYSARLDGQFAAAKDSLGATNIRYPGGTMTEESFSLTDPNRTLDDFGRKLVPLNEFLDLAIATESEVTIVLPTRDLLANEVDSLGNRFVDTSKISEVSNFVISTLLQVASEGNIRATDLIKAFEIGNEYWGSGEMTATEYGRIVNAVAPAVAHAIESVLGPAALAEIGILAQMGSPLGEQFQDDGLYGSLNALSDPNLLASLGLTPSDFGAGGTLKWLTKVEIANRDIINQISSEAKEAISGLVEHFYFVTEADDLQFSSNQLRYIDRDQKLWIDAGYGDKDFVMTEWNIQAENQDQFGLKGAGAVLFQFESMVRMNFTEAYSWPILDGNTTELAGALTGDLYLSPAGAILHHMASNITNLSLITIPDSTPNLEMAAYGSVEKLVVYIASRDASLIDLTADLSDLSNNMSLTSAELVTVDISKSDGFHKLKNGSIVPTPYYQENDLPAIVKDLVEQDIYQNHILHTALAPYEVLMLVFENRTVLSDVNYTLSATAVALSLTGSQPIDGVGNDLNNRITGNLAANRLIGGLGNDTLAGLGGADTLVGGSGNDVYLIDQFDTVTEVSNNGVDRIEANFSYKLLANFENLTLLGNQSISGTGNSASNHLVGNSANNLLAGEAGNDTLEGGLGSDTLNGGIGDDVYIAGLDDTINEKTNQGIDLVLSVQSYKLGVNLELLTLTGNEPINGTGNLLNNVITGNSNNNVIDGISGRDTMIGGAGNDTYYTNGLDLIVEYGNEGVDQVVASVSHTLADNIENLLLSGAGNLNGTGNALNNSIVGNNGANTLDGMLGSDTLSGGLGNDTYIVDKTDVVVELPGGGKDIVITTGSYTLPQNVEDLRLTGTSDISGIGNSLPNTLTGNGGANILIGGAGADTLVGMGGNDTYYSDSLDVIKELTNGGIDLIISAESYKLGINVENLTLSGNLDVNGTGNLLNNLLTGNDGNNVLDGLTGKDTMVGGGGNDIYYTNGLDLIVENPDHGYDVVISSASHSLFENIEELRLTGTANLNGVGNSSGNRIVGNAGNNSLEGGFGNDTLDGGIGGDTLIGGEGADVFLFNSKIGGSNIDRISDFDVSCDVILLNSTIFSGFDGGIITGDQLAFNNLGRAVDGSDRIIYETDTGALLYDSDGAGVKIAVKFAQLAPWLDLSIDNFALL